MLKKLLAFLTVCIFTLGCFSGLSLAKDIEYRNPNYDMIMYSELKGWLDDISKKSSRVSYEVVGQSAGGRDIYKIIVTEPSAHGKLGKYIAIRNTMMKDPAKAKEMIARDPDYKVPIFINNSVHGGETTAVDASVKLIEELAFENTEEVQKILKDTIIVFNLCSNPDGRVNGWRHNDNGFDNNRDMVTQSQPETRAIVDMVAEWKPMVVLDNHGYVYPILIEPASMPHNPNYEGDLYQKWALGAAESMEDRLKKEMPDEYPYAEIPYRDYDKEGGWDDYPAIFIPQYSQYYALTTHTIEVGYRTYEGVLGHYWSNKAALLYAAENKEAMFKDQIEIFKRGMNYGGPEGHEFPEAYIIPAEKPLQANPQETVKLINHLIKSGLEVEISTQEFKVNGKSYPKGTYIVPMNQPLAGLANSLLWKGEDISVDPGLPMYDISAWNLPELWGFTRDIAKESLNVKTAPINKAVLKPGKIIHNTSKYYILACDTNDSIKAVNELLAKGASVMQTQIKEDELPAGTFIIESDDRTLNNLAELSKKYGIDFNGSNDLPGSVKELKKVKIAALTTFNGSKLTDKISGTSNLYYIGPMAFVLKDLGFDVDVLWPGNVNEKGLEGYDMVVGTEKLSESNFTREGWEKLNEFFKKGGKYVGYGSGGAASSNNLGLLKSTPVVKEGNGIVNLNYNDESSISGSYPVKGTGFIYNPVYFKDLDSGVKVLASYEKDDLFMAGYWPLKDREGFSGSPAIVKNDKAVVFGTDPIFRAHIKDGFRLVSNAIYELTSK